METLIIVALVLGAIVLIPVGILVWAVMPSKRGAVKWNRRQAVKEQRDRDAYVAAARKLEAEGWTP